MYEWGGRNHNLAYLCTYSEDFQYVLFTTREKVKKNILLKGFVTNTAVPSGYFEMKFTQVLSADTVA